jgi:hypothetical protein
MRGDIVICYQLFVLFYNPKPFTMNFDLCAKSTIFYYEFWNVKNKNSRILQNLRSSGIWDRVVG